MRHKEYLVDFINSNKLEKIIEIGVWKGQTTRHILRNCPSVKEYWACDPWTQEVYQGETHHMATMPEDQWTNLYFRLCLDMSYYSGLRVVKAKSDELARILARQVNYFDLIYLDARHEKEDVLEDIKTWLPFVKDDCFLGGHDYNKGGHKGHDVAGAVNSSFNSEEISLGPDGVWLVKVNQIIKKRVLSPKL